MKNICVSHAMFLNVKKMYISNYSWLTTIYLFMFNYIVQGDSLKVERSFY